MAGYDAGTTPDDVCADPSIGAGGVGKAVLTPRGGFLAHAAGRDVNLGVFQFGGGPVTTQCQLVGAPVLGPGTGKFTYHVMDTGPGALVIHVTVQGTVELVTGGQARLFARRRALWRGPRVRCCSMRSGSG
jgi:hypothetical protein